MAIRNRGHDEARDLVTTFVQARASRDADKRHEWQNVQRLKAEYLRAKARVLRTDAGQIGMKYARADYLEAKATFIERWKTEDLPAFPKQVGSDG